MSLRLCKTRFVFCYFRGEKQEEDPANDLTPVSKLWTAIVVMGMTIMTMTMMMTMPMMMMMMTMMMMMVMVMVMVMVMMIADSR